MAALLRPFLVLLLAVTLLWATSFEVHANLTTEIAATSEPCCDGDCSQDPACGATCKLMQRCGAGMTAVLQAADPSPLDPHEVANLIPGDQSPPGETLPHGLKRPPRT
jgi:hypothetical protein